MKDMSKLTFTEQQASAITAIACNEARGDQSSLLNAINEGFDAKLSANQIKEALSQLYAYTGFPRSLNSLGTLQKVIAQRTDINQGAESSPMPSDYNALTQGTEIQTKLTGQPFNYEFCPAEDYYLKAHLFGDIFARDFLTHADRELVKPGVTIAVPEGVKHWHGAAADSWMQHLTYHADAKPGNSNEWLEPVSDEVYGKLR